MEAKGNHGSTPLQVAAENGHDKVVELLLQNGANLEAKTNKGWTPLLGAARMGQPAAISSSTTLLAFFGGAKQWSPTFVGLGLQIGSVPWHKGGVGDLVVWIGGENMHAIGQSKSRIRSAAKLSSNWLP